MFQYGGWQSSTEGKVTTDFYHLNCTVVFLHSRDLSPIAISLSKAEKYKIADNTAGFKKNEGEISGPAIFIYIMV